MLSSRRSGGEERKGDHNDVVDFDCILNEKWLSGRAVAAAASESAVVANGYLSTPRPRTEQ
jgi:hypothetical protein